MEVTAGQYVALVSKDQWVIGHRVGFNFQHFGGLANLRQAGTHHLWLAAQGVRILHFFTVAV
ncbi:hypothetical protein D3C73_1386290 [compost metagenome]